jgi:hypothetical protein
MKTLLDRQGLPGMAEQVELCTLLFILVNKKRAVSSILTALLHISFFL